MVCGVWCVCLVCGVCVCVVYGVCVYVCVEFGVVWCVWRMCVLCVCCVCGVCVVWCFFLFFINHQHAPLHGNTTCFWVRYLQYGYIYFYRYSKFTFSFLMYCLLLFNLLSTALLTQ